MSLHLFETSQKQKSSDRSKSVNVFPNHFFFNKFQFECAQFSRTREDDGTPLQYSCLETPMDGGAWQAAVHGIWKSQIRLSDFTFAFHFQSQTRLKQLSSSRSSSSKAVSFPKLFPKRQKGGELLEKKKIKGISQLSLVSRSKKSGSFECCHYLFFS